jgi:hypothetical protein
MLIVHKASDLTAEEATYLRDKRRQHQFDQNPLKADGSEYTDAEIRIYEENRSIQWLQDFRAQQAATK